MVIIAFIASVGCTGPFSSNSSSSPTEVSPDPETDDPVQDPESGEETDNGPGVELTSYSFQGVIQKGPFLQGSEVIVKELDGELGATGRTFSLTTEDDTGRFYFQGELIAPYIEIIATGDYFNEVTGAVSTGSVSLHALVDVTDRTNVNVNALTHLERRRVESLVGSGHSFSTAKVTARQEVLSVFGIDLPIAGNPEDSDIRLTGDHNAAAPSVIVSGRSVPCHCVTGPQSAASAWFA